MTGAPKLRTCDIINELERTRYGLEQPLVPKHLKLNQVECNEKLEFSKENDEDNFNYRKRGIYSGALGYITPWANAMDFNIVIRTAVIKTTTLSDSEESSFEEISQSKARTLEQSISIGAGGAITILSDPEAEYEEMMLKSRAIKESVIRCVRHKN